MKTTISLFLSLFLIGGCAQFQVQENREKFAYNLGRVAAEKVLDNNRSYIPEAEQGIEDGLTLVTGQDIDVAKAARGILAFVDKLMADNFFEDETDLIREILTLLDDVFQVNMAIPEKEQWAAAMVRNFLEGAKQGLENIKDTI